MSGFLLAAGSWAERLYDVPFSIRLLKSMAKRGSPSSRARTMDGVAILAVRHDWEDSVTPGPNVFEHAPFLLAADASLYYANTLRERLKGTGFAAAGESDAALIGHSFAQFGSECINYIEGDYAFVVWDARTRAVFAARDPFGTRSLFHAARDGGLAIASTPDPLRLLLDSSDISPNDLIRSITGYHGDGTGGPWRGISELPAGWSLVAKDASAPRVARFWYPKSIPEWRNATSPEAALILRDLIGDATRERMPADGAAVGMSGGRDSTAIVGAVEDQRRRRVGGSVPPLTVLSYSYPQGDPGNEDHFVNQVASVFNLHVNWIETESIPVFQNAIARPDRRTRPEAQPFEGLNRALAREALNHGVRVVLNGNGGDNVFGLPDIWLADLLRSGRWVRLAKELHTRRYPSVSWLMRTCLRPAMPLALMDRTESILGRRILSRPWESHPPHWLVKGALESAGIVDEDRANYRRDIASVTASVAGRMRLWALLFPGFSRNCADLFDMTLAEGAELRMPLYDQRVVNFAWSRPPYDLNNGIEHKAILRDSMTQILPQDMLASRKRRTGTSEGYFLRMAKKEFPAFAHPLLEDSVLGQLGIIDPLLLRSDIEGWDSAAQKPQVFTVTACCVESWLRAHI